MVTSFSAGVSSDPGFLVICDFLACRGDLGKRRIFRAVRRYRIAKRPRGARRPGFAYKRPSSETEGAGNAGHVRRTRSLVCIKKAYEHSRHRFTGRTGIPCANGFNGLLRALPGDRLYCLRHPREHRLASLISASGYQDHTTSPSAPAHSSLAPQTSIASRTQRP